jgi:type III secretory pathway component EscS
VPASSCLYFLLCSVYSEASVNLIVGLLQTEYQANGDKFQLKIQWAEIKLCLVRASSCLYFLLSSVSSEPSVNLIIGLLQTQHQANDDQCKVKDAVTEGMFYYKA